MRKEKEKKIRLQMNQSKKRKKEKKVKVLTSVVTARLCSRSSLFPTSAITMLGLA